VKTGKLLLENLAHHWPIDADRAPPRPYHAFWGVTLVNKQQNAHCVGWFEVRVRVSTLVCAHTTTTFIPLCDEVAHIPAPPATLTNVNNTRAQKEHAAETWVHAPAQRVAPMLSEGHDPHVPSVFAAFRHSFAGSERCLGA
jgi:hypothetical protein